MGAWGIQQIVRKHQGRPTQPVGPLIASVIVLVWFGLSSSVPAEFVAMTPYVATLLVLAFASQKLRMPAADGAIYRKGEAK